MSNNLRTRNGMPFNFVNGLKVRGMDIESLIPGIEGIPEAGSKYQFAGNGTNKSFTLPVSPYNKDAVDVYVKQLYVHPDDYTLVGDTVTLVEAPPAVVAGETYNVVVKVSLTTLNGYVNANRVSFEGENLDDILEKGKPLANYSTLRAYAGAATQVRITDPGIAGFFYYDAADTSSVDNGGTVIVSNNGKRWKRAYDGSMNAFWFMSSAQITDVQSMVPAIDVTQELNYAAGAARLAGKALKLPPVKSHYPISATVDFTGIKIIDGKNARLKGAVSGFPAAIIGGVNDSEIWLEVQNTQDKSIVDGTIGIKIIEMNKTRCYLYARGFDEGLYFDGSSANRAWVGNEINIIGLYNNGTHVHFNLSGSSYAVHNQFIGGSYYLGTNQLKNNRGTVKATLSGAALLSELLFVSPEIGIDGGSRAADHSLFFCATLNTTSTGNTVVFRDARLELYASSPYVPHYVNIPTTTAGYISVDVEALAMPTVNCQMNIGNAPHNVFLNYTGISGTNPVIRKYSNIKPTFPYQINGRIYVPERIVYNANYTAPADYITEGVSFAGANRAIGDGKLLLSSTSVAIGTKWKKTIPSRNLFLKLSGYGQIVVICYDAAGNVLTGTAPWYCVMRGVRNINSAGVDVYQGLTDWVYIHPDVDSFFIGWCAWSNSDYYADLQFEVTLGPDLERQRDSETASSMIGFSSSVQSYLHVGATIDNATSTYKNELFVKTVTTKSELVNATTVTVADASGVNTNCQIGIELDTVVTNNERRYQHCSITAVNGNIITISPALTAAVSSGRKVLINKWSVR